MDSIYAIWKKSRETFDSKTLPQILSFAGDGKLRDNNITSKEFREFLSLVPSSLLIQFVEDCLTIKFEDNGFALQDIINQIGARLGFKIEYGLYRGKQNEIGYDGIWTSDEGYNLVLEVKTTDAYRINLDTIAEYRKKLVDELRIDKDDSSILIVVGRQDTGDLEAQIRGSKHAWDIRLISSDSLTKLLNLKETLNDIRTIQQINEILKPNEYTRIDKLIELIFLTTRDLQVIDPEDNEVDDISIVKKIKINSQVRDTPVNFHDECIELIQNKLNLNLIKQSRIAYSTIDGSTGLICAISRPHKQGHYEKFWFAFHPYQNDYLAKYANKYVAYGCGTAENTILIPFNEFEPLIKNMWTTETESRMYWHVVIHYRDNRFLLAQPQIERGHIVDITKYKLNNNTTI